MVFSSGERSWGSVVLHLIDRLMVSASVCIIGLKFSWRIVNLGSGLLILESDWSEDVGNIFYFYANTVIWKLIKLS